VATKLVVTNAKALLASGKSLEFGTTNVASPAARNIIQGKITGYNSLSSWKSFQKFNCVLSTVKMACSAWVSKTSADGGYSRWTEGQSVVFWWYDGRDLSNASKYPVDSYDKWTSEAVTLVYDASAGAEGVVKFTGLVTLVAGITALTF